MVRNFLFHRVNSERDVLWDPMDPVLFEKCIHYISKNYEVAQFEELMQDGRARESKREFATIVFDDGFKDNIQYAVPILDKYKVKASFYVVTDCIEKNIPTWTYNLDYAFQHTRKKEIDLTFSFLPAELRVTSIPGTQNRIEYVKKLKPALKRVTHEQRNSILESIHHAYDDVALPKLMMNWRDLQELKNYGHYVGSHTITHCMLGTITDENEILTELSKSAKKINEELGHFPLTISYPVGSYNETTMRLSKQTGYKYGLAVKQKIYDPAKDDDFEIPRIELYNEPWLKSKLRIKDFIGTISRIIHSR